MLIVPTTAWYIIETFTIQPKDQVPILSVCDIDNLPFSCTEESDATLSYYLSGPHSLKGSSDEPLKYSTHQGYVLASLLFSQYSFPLFNGYDS